MIHLHLTPNSSSRMKMPPLGRGQSKIPNQVFLSV